MSVMYIRSDIIDSFDMAMPLKKNIDFIALLGMKSRQDMYVPVLRT